MEKTIEPKQKEEIFNLGKEFAFEGLDMRHFKAKSADELRIFKEGFKEGLKLMQENSNELEENKGMSIAA